MKEFADAIGVGLDDYNRNGPNFKNLGSSAYPWTYQYCTEFGWYQVPAHRDGWTRMRADVDLDLDYWERTLCGSMASTVVHANPDKDVALHRTVSEYGGCIGETGIDECDSDSDYVIRYGGSNVVFTNGVEDPWQWATEQKGNAAFNQVSLMADCENCGHCAELYTPLDSDAKELNDVRQKVIDFLADILNVTAPAPFSVQIDLQVPQGEITFLQ